MGEDTFTSTEYAVFIAILGLSALVGLYFGLARKQDTLLEYMLGGRKMSVLPISLSLVASDISGITILGSPAETYKHGSQISMTGVSRVLVAIFVITFIVPVVHHLQINSIFEYLERRFDRKVRFIASLLFVIHLITFIPVVIYVPAVALKQVTGIPVEIVAPAVCAICILYTTLGGLKAVVWSDTVQSFFIFVSIVAVTVIGVRDCGGLARIMEVSEAGRRLEFFIMDPNVCERNTLLSTVSGSLIFATAIYSMSPSFIQRYTAIATFKDTIKVTVIFIIGYIVVKVISVLDGLIIYTKYHDCDPVITKAVEKADQILPHYVMGISKGIPGLPGLFFAGVFSAALSSMSTGLNTIAGTIFDDFIKPMVPWELSELASNRVVKFTVLVLGIICVLNVFVVQRLGGALQASISLSGIAAGPIFFLYVSGMFIPWIPSKGALWGSLSGLLVMGWIVFRAQSYIAQGEITFPGKSTSIAGCPNGTFIPNGLNGAIFGYKGVGSPTVFNEDVPYIYRISFFHYSTLGAMVSFLVGTIVTFIVGTTDLKTIDPKLIVVQMRRFLPRTELEMNEKEEVPLKRVINGNC